MSLSDSLTYHDMVLSKGKSGFCPSDLKKFKATPRPAEFTVSENLYKFKVPPMIIIPVMVTYSGGVKTTGPGKEKHLLCNYRNK